MVSKDLLNKLLIIHLVSALYDGDIAKQKEVLKEIVQDIEEQEKKLFGEIS